MSFSINQGDYVLFKLGTESLRYELTNRLDDDTVLHVCRKAAGLYKRGISPLIVSSGALLVGMEEEEIDEIPGNSEEEILEKQSLSGVGQAGLISAYRRYMKRAGLNITQALVTHKQISDKGYRNSLVSVINAGLAKGRIPVFNENDVLCSEEFKTGFRGHDYYFDDNDGLAYLISSEFGAKACIFFNPDGGLYDEDGELIQVAYPEDKERFTSMVERRKSSNGGRGGVQSKVEYAFSCSTNGIAAVMANSSYIKDDKGDILELLCRDKKHDRTLFVPRGE